MGAFRNRQILRRTQNAIQILPEPWLRAYTFFM
jgi:hypothetical protein